MQFQPCATCSYMSSRRGKRTCRFDRRDSRNSLQRLAKPADPTGAWSAEHRLERVAGVQAPALPGARSSVNSNMPRWRSLWNHTKHSMLSAGISGCFNCATAIVSLPTTFSLHGMAQVGVPRRTQSSISAAHRNGGNDLRVATTWRADRHRRSARRKRHTCPKIGSL